MHGGAIREMISAQSDTLYLTGALDDTASYITIQRVGTATAGATTKNSNSLTFGMGFWTGAAASTKSYTLQGVMESGGSATPTYRFNISDSTGTYLRLRNVATALEIDLDQNVNIANAKALSTSNTTDGDYFTIRARDSDTDALVEVARVQGAAVPYFHAGYGSGTTPLGVGIHTEIVTVDHASHASLNAAAVTDNALLWQAPAGSVVLGIRGYLTEQFVATSLTDIDFTLGENGGDADGWLVQAMNGTSDAVATQYKTRGALWDTSAEGVFAYFHTATDIYLFVTATGANLNTLTAGTWTFYITYMDLP